MIGYTRFFFKDQGLIFIRLILHLWIQSLFDFFLPLQSNCHFTYTYLMLLPPIYMFFWIPHFFSPPHGFLPHIPFFTLGRYTSLKIFKALYGLKPAGHTWYHHMYNFLISKGFPQNPIILYIFMYCTFARFVIVVVYVDDPNVINTSNLSQYIQKLLIQYFDMKFLSKITFCLGL